MILLAPARPLRSLTTPYTCPQAELRSQPLQAPLFSHEASMRKQCDPQLPPPLACRRASSLLWPPGRQADCNRLTSRSRAIAGVGSNDSVAAASDSVRPSQCLRLIGHTDTHIANSNAVTHACRAVVLSLQAVSVASRTMFCTLGPTRSWRYSGYQVRLMPLP